MFYKLTKAQFPFQGTLPELKKKSPRIPVNSIVEDDPDEGENETLTADGKLRKIKFRVVGNIRRGWLPVEFLEEAEAAERPGVIPWAFITTCVRAEEWINAMPDTGVNYVHADYLIALAIYETKMANVGNETPGTDAVGPFQITSTRWKEFLDASGDPDFVEDDRDNISDQIYGMAFLTREHTRTISDVITAHEKAAGSSPDADKAGPYIPTFADIFIAAVVTPLAAIELRKLELSGKSDTLITEIVSGLDDDRKKEMQRIFRHNHHILKVDKTEAEANGIAAGPRTVGNLYEVVEEKLDKLFGSAFKLMKENVPELLPVTSGAATWLPTALAEQSNPWNDGALKEGTQLGTDRVLTYFKATDLATNKVLPWCGAFVAFCMKQAGGEVAGSIVKGAARAANWKSWGNLSIPVKTGNVPAGAVVVMSPPPGSARSGHVGFCSPDQSGKAGKITLLGGNQSDTVKNSDYDRSKIAAIRWLGPPLGSFKEDTASDTIPPGDGIAWGGFVDRKFGNDEFKKKVIEIGSRIQCDPNFLMAVMAFETGRSFSAKQKNLAGGSATGLIQFMPTTAAELGTSTAELAQMTENRQLDFVEAYMKKKANGRPFTKLADVYMAVLWPVAFGKSEGSAIFKHPEKAYKSNRGLDLNGDKKVTVGEAAAKVKEQLQRGLEPENRG
ncbi:uncharacterized protein (TIGR02594 family) [Labrenzia sp. EL_208]|nr:uncharacterized protein (TIGR02594 family) [Labrenzia sp. EL_132]MBG6227777.1 uncharacterized protein (TIGR02594 family) [Labrenzia sp. EL_208]